MPFITDLPYPYIITFFTSIVAGEFAFAPIIFLAATSDALYLPYTLLAVLSGTIVADSIWYSIGRNNPKEKIYSFPFIKKRAKKLERFSSFFERNYILFLLLTKFVYGTRTISQIVAGIHKIPYKKFIGVSAFGSAIWIGLLTGIASLLSISLERFMETSYDARIIFALFILFIASTYLIFNKIILPKWIKKE
jgi:membrane protein DedA with SNARE-associated domain